MYNERINETGRKQRVQYIDIARGIAILLMIIGHVVNHGLFRDFIFSFHMPLFFITGGMCYRPKKVKSALITDLRKIILPYALVLLILDLWEGTATPAYYLRQFLWAAPWQNKKMYEPEIGAAFAMWFFPTFFMTRWIFRILERFCKGRLFLLAFLSMIISFWGMAWGMEKWQWLPFNLDVAMSSTGFYSFGYLIRAQRWNNRTDYGRIKILAAAIVWLFGIHYCPIELAARSYPIGVFSFITAACGCTVVFYLSTWISEHTLVTRRILSWYGKNSNLILCFHALDTIPQFYFNAFIPIPDNKKIAHVIFAGWRILLSSIGATIDLRILRLYNKIMRINK